MADGLTNLDVLHVPLYWETVNHLNFNPDSSKED